MSEIYTGKIDLPPLSANKAWKGRRFKTKEYQQYELAVSLLLPKFVLPATNLKLSYEFGFSNKASDLDNPVKMFQDILCKKYNFDDREIYELVVKKKIVEKGKEYIKFSITPME